MGGWKGERTLYPNLQGGKFAQEKLVKRVEMVNTPSSRSTSLREAFTENWLEQHGATIFLPPNWEEFPAIFPPLLVKLDLNKMGDHLEVMLIDADVSTGLVGQLQ
jgi:hypothetical protein